MAYEEQSSSDQYGDLDRLLARYPAKDLVSQIPGQTAEGARTEAPKSLREKAASALTQANPLMMRKSMEDMARTLVGGAALPVVAPVSAGIQALNALPGNLLRRSRGEEEIATPSTEELMRKYGEVIAPKTQMGRDFEEGLGKAMDTAKIPHAWSLSPPAPRRPMLTPTDVRVGAGQIKQLAKELRETPADFQAAQSGLKRQNLYGEDTIGVKAQAAADALGDTLERRQMAGKSAIPGVPQALTPDTKMYAVRPKGTRMVQPKVPKSAGAYRPDVSPLEGIVEDVYGDTPAAQMPPEMISSEYAKRFLTPDSELAGAFKNYMTLRVQEMFPDAPTPRAAQNAYDLLYANRSERTKQQMVELEEFLNFPENAAYLESVPTPTEFMQRMGEAERVIKGPFTTFLSKNVGAEGDPTVKLARQGITFESPEAIRELSYYVTPADLAAKRLEAGFPIMGTYAEEHFQKGAEFDALTREIEALEAVRRPLFDRAHEEGIDPASIPEYAETTNPLRQKLRQREQLQGEIENIKLARTVEDISDSAIAPKTKQEMLERIPFEQRQFYPGVTKAGEGEKFYVGQESIIRDLGFKKLGKELVEDILTGKAGDTSKLTIENYMREKGLSRIEAEKAAKLQEQQYRKSLETVLLDRIRNDQNVQTFGNAAIITLDKNTPKDVAMRDMSADTLILDHCVGECGTAPQGRKNVLSGKQQYYESVIDPITGRRNPKSSNDTSFVRGLENGNELVSVRDLQTGFPAATIQLMPNRDGTFSIGWASGSKNGAIDPVYTPAIRDYLNQRASNIRDTGDNLAKNTGVFDSQDRGEWSNLVRQAKLTKKQAEDINAADFPRFVTVDDVKAAAKGMTGTEVAVVEPQRQAPEPVARGRVTFNEFTADLTFDEVERLVSNIANDPTYTRRQLQRLQTLIEDPDHRAFRMLDGDQINGLLDLVEGGLQQPRARTRQAPVVEPQRQAGAVAQQGQPVPIPEDLDATTLLAGYADRLSPEQTRWLQNWMDQYDRSAEGSRQEQRLIDVYYEWQAGNTLAPARQQANLAPIPENLEPQDLLDGYSDRLSPEQIRWLEDWNRQLEEVSDGARTIEDIEDPVAQNEAYQLYERYDTWRETNRLSADPLANLFDDLEPDPTAVANQGAGLPAPVEVSPARQNELYRNYVDNLDIDADGLTVQDLADLIRGNDTVGTPNTTEVERNALAALVEEYGLRDNFDPAQLPAPVEPQPAVQIAQRAEVPMMRASPVPRQIQAMPDLVLFNGMTGAGLARARELANTYFNDNIVDGANLTIGALTGMLRNYSAGPHSDASYEVRELTARNLERMHEESMGSAEQLADSLNEAFYIELDPQEAMSQIDRDISSLERNGELAWEDLVGPMAEDIPWNRNVQHHLLGYLRALAEQYADMRRAEDPDGFAKGGMVKKKHMAKKDGMPLILTRKSPELTELAYQYGGIVG
jgi:hypothetical protein